MGGQWKGGDSRGFIQRPVVVSIVDLNLFLFVFYGQNAISCLGCSILYRGSAGYLCTWMLA